MELINALVLAGPLGWLIRDRRRSLGLWLALWAVVLPIQTAVVARASSDDVTDPLYAVFNAGILVLGIALNVGGARLRARRDAARQRRRPARPEGRRHGWRPEPPPM